MYYSVGLVNAQCESPNLFNLVLVDEENKNKAMNGQDFHQIAAKSHVEMTNCVQDTSPPIRYPSKLYMLVLSGSDIDIRYNIGMSCVISQFTHIITTYRGLHFPRVYFGQEMQFEFSFENQYNQVDTWTEGEIYAKVASGSVSKISKGEAKLVYTPRTKQLDQVSFSYKIDGNTFDFDSAAFDVFEQAKFGSVNAPEKVESKKEFTVNYLIKDSDDTVTPLLDKTLLKLEDSPGSDVVLKCTPPTSDSGNGSVICTASKAGKITIQLSYGLGQVAESNFITIVDSDPGNDPDFVWTDILRYLVIVLPIVLVTCVVCVVVVVVIAIYCKRKKSKVKRAKLLGDSNDNNNVVAAEP